MDDVSPTDWLLQALFVTGLMGGLAAWLSGRAIALTWRPPWNVVLYMALLGAAVRFVHFALFQVDLLSPGAYAVDTLYLLVVGALSWRITRTTQMVTQYPWLHERQSLVAWRARAVAENSPADGTKV